MKMRAAAVLLLLSLPACDSTGIKVSPLTPAQTTAILRELADLTLWIEEGVNMIRCPLGGGARIAYSEEFLESGDTVTVFGRWNIAPEGCEIQTVGDTLVLEGDPSVVFEREFRHLGFLEEGWMDMEVAGAVTWRKNDDTPGTCEVDVAVEDAEVDVRDTGEIDGTLEGRLCGFAVAIHFSEMCRIHCAGGVEIGLVACYDSLVGWLALDGH